MKKVLKTLASLIVVALIGAVGVLSFSPTLRSDPNVGLSPETHAFGGVDVRQFTDAPLGAEVKVFLPISPTEAVALASGFDRYPDWVAPPPENVVVDNSARETGDFGSGSLVTYKEGETDEIVYYDPTVAMIAETRWGLSDFAGHRGVVIVTPAEGGSIMHMRRYFEPTSVRGWMMSRMMPMFMEASAANLAELYGGEVL